MTAQALSKRRINDIREGLSNRSRKRPAVDEPSQRRLPLAARFVTAQTSRVQPDSLEFIVYIDAVAWDLRATHSPELGRASGFPIQREALVFHELCHLRHSHTSDGEPRYHEDGRALLALQTHTCEFFASELRRLQAAHQRSRAGRHRLRHRREGREKTRRRRSKRRAASVDVIRILSSQ